jgi:hypothetical protein
VRETIAEDDMRRTMNSVEAHVQASLALHRATLHALAALSPVLNTAADAALEEEAMRAGPAQVREIVEDTRLRLRRAPGEARIARALQHALVEAAEALPPARTARAA